MKGLLDLRFQLLFFLSSSIFSVLIGMLGNKLGTLAFWTILIAFFGVVFLIVLITGFQEPSRIDFVHILVLMTAVTWLAYGVTMLTGESVINVDALLMTFMQNMAGLSVLSWIVAALTKSRFREKGMNWINALFFKADSLSFSSITIILLLYVGLIVNRLSMGLVISGIGDVMEDASVLQSILLQLVSPISGVINVLTFVLLLGTNNNRKKLGMILFFMQIVLLFLEGRRPLIEFLFLGSLIWIGLRGLNLKRIAVVCGVVFLIISVSGPFFLMLRTTAFEDRINIVGAASRAATLLDSSEVVFNEFKFDSWLNSDYIENVKYRSSFLDWTVEVQERVMEGWSPRWGEVALKSTMELVPRILLPQKLEMLGNLRVEQLIQVWFGLPVMDSANTILACAIADGGLIGVVIYFAAFGIIMAVLGSFIITSNSIMSKFWAVATLFGICFNIEQGLGDLLGAVRMLIIVFLLDRLVKVTYWRRLYCEGL